MWELVARSQPFSEYDTTYKSGPTIKLEDDIVQIHLRPTIPSHANDTLKTLIAACWDPVPSARPSFNEILRKLGGEEEVFVAPNLLSRDVTAATGFGEGEVGGKLGVEVEKVNQVA